MVSMPVLNRGTPLNRDFDSSELMPNHNDMGAVLDRLSFWIVVTSDHGALVGVEGYVGHGTFARDKVLEVPFVERRIR